MRVAAINRATLCLFVCLCKLSSLSHLPLLCRLAPFSILHAHITHLSPSRRCPGNAAHCGACERVCVGSREYFTALLRLCISSVAWLPLRQRRCRCHCRRRHRCCCCCRCGVVSLLQFAWQLPVCCLPFGQRQRFSRVLVLVFLPCFSFFFVFRLFFCCVSPRKCFFNCTNSYDIIACEKR